MNRYFIEVAYNGGRYAGSQVQANAHTVQAELERALGIYFRRPVSLTGSSRTDAGVHALQNYFHVDMEEEIPGKAIYNLNAILPADIAIRRIFPVKADAHCRFDAVAREYRYYIYRAKDPFLEGRGYFFPYRLDTDLLQQAAGLLLRFEDFTSFSKRNTQARTFSCKIERSEWRQEGKCWVYEVRGNRFLRGMVRGLVGTMLQVGRGKIGLEEWVGIIEARDCTKADFAVPGQGLFLAKVEYDEGAIMDGRDGHVG